ncbi:hypothetical protein ACFW81_23605 [Streptomyces angustmyceticus]|uniref:hypothetical protein n=1 Tax=Streptomyces angustmyceticus TaxID=285578 RepID=UPI0036A31C5C
MSPDKTSPVPHLAETRTVKVLEEGQSLSDEQRARIKAWLTANSIEPRLVSADQPVLVEYKTTADRSKQSAGHIHFTQYYVDEEGQKNADCSWKGGALSFPRCVRQKVELEPEPDGDGNA